MKVIEVKPHPWGWKVFEGSSVEPVFREKAIGVLQIASPPRNCSHEALPFVEAAAKAKLGGRIETQPGVHLAALSAFRIVGIPIMAARNKDVRRQGIVFAFH
jgi:hypothetical protein